jgi:hypothetical protein
MRLNLVELYQLVCYLLYSLCIHRGHNTRRKRTTGLQFLTTNYSILVFWCVVDGASSALIKIKKASKGSRI